MLGRERLGERERGVEVGGVDADPVLGQQLGVVADRHHERVASVLGLRGEVRGRPRGIGARGEDHAEVARPGEAVDPDEPAETCRLASCT